MREREELDMNTRGERPAAIVVVVVVDVEG